MVKSKWESRHKGYRSVLLTGCVMAACCLSGAIMQVEAAVLPVAIDETNFPDTNFRSIVKNTYDDNHNGYLERDEVITVKELDLYQKCISDLAGIEYFISIEAVNCSGNYLTELNVSECASLRMLRCDSMRLESLDVSGCTQLEGLACFNNYLEELDLSNNRKLQHLECQRTKIKNLDVSNNVELTFLECSLSGLEELNVSNNRKLNTLSCSNNRLTELDVSNNNDIQALHCNGNLLSKLDLGNLTKLVDFSCTDNKEQLRVHYIDVSTIEGFDMTKTSAWTNARVEGNMVSAKDIARPITYNYDCGNGFSATFSFIPGEAESHSVFFNANGGSVNLKSKQVLLWSVYGDLPTPTRDGYTFTGWYASEAGGEQITAQSILRTGGEQILYARWESLPKSFTIIFNGNGGSVTISSKKVTQNESYGSLPQPKRNKYVFKGWYTDKTGGREISASSKVEISGNQTLYARWEKVSVGKTKISKLKNQKGKQAVVTLKKTAKADGYQVVYSVNKKFKSAKKTLITASKVTLKKLKKGKTYYVKARAYRKDSAGKKIYGKYCTAKKVKIKQ